MKNEIEKGANENTDFEAEKLELVNQYLETSIMQTDRVVFFKKYILPFFIIGIAIWLIILWYV